MEEIWEKRLNNKKSLYDDFKELLDKFEMKNLKGFWVNDVGIEISEKIQSFGIKSD